MARGGFGGRQRMAKEWSKISASVNNLTGGGTTAGGSLGFAIPGTVLRMIGDYYLAPGNATIVAGDAATVTIGIGLVSSDVVALGATAFPDPADEPEFPWLYYRSHGLFFGQGTDDPGNAGESVRIAFDIRTMRKFKPRESLVWAVQYEDDGGAPAIRLGIGHVRVLIAT